MGMPAAPIQPWCGSSLVVRALIRWSAVLLACLQAVPAGTIRAEKKVRVAINGASSC